MDTKRNTLSTVKHLLPAISVLSPLSQSPHTAAGETRLGFYFCFITYNTSLLNLLTRHCNEFSLNRLSAGTTLVLPSALIFNQTWMENLIVLLCNCSASGYSREIFIDKSRPDGEERNKPFLKLVSIKSAAKERLSMC